MGSRTTFVESGDLFSRGKYLLWSRHTVKQSSDHVPTGSDDSTGPILVLRLLQKRNKSQRPAWRRNRVANLPISSRVELEDLSLDLPILSDHLGHEAPRS